MKNILLFIVSLLVLGCAKDEIAELSTAYPLEGTYEGTSLLDCPDLGIHKQRMNTIEITASSAEKITVRTMRTTATASMGYHYYRYQPFYWVGTSDCGKPMNVTYQGSGQLKGDSLIEQGSAIVNGYQATWQTKSIKLKKEV